MAKPAGKKSNIDILMESLDLKGKNVIDIGCGDGELAHRMAAAGARVTGIDPNPKRIDRARAEGSSGAAFQEGKAEALPCPDGSVDVAIFFNSLHHVPVAAMDKALAEAARVLKPGGILYVSEPVAAGAHYEAMKPINDEAPIRAEALAAIGRAAKGPFHQESEDVSRVVRFEPDFETYVRRMIDANPSREPMVKAKMDDIRTRFLSAARKTAEGYEIDRQTRFTLLRRV